MQSVLNELFKVSNTTQIRLKLTRTFGAQGGGGWNCPPSTKMKEISAPSECRLSKRWSFGATRLCTNVKELTPRRVLFFNVHKVLKQKSTSSNQRAHGKWSLPSPFPLSFPLSTRWRRWWAALGRPSSAPTPTPAPTPASFVFRIRARVVLSINRLVHIRWAPRATGRMVRAMGLRGGGSSTGLFQGGAKAGHNTLDELFGRRRKLDGRQWRPPWLRGTTRRHGDS